MCGSYEKICSRYDAHIRRTLDRTNGLLFSLASQSRFLLIRYPMDHHYRSATRARLCSSVPSTIMPTAVSLASGDPTFPFQRSRTNPVGVSMGAPVSVGKGFFWICRRVFRLLVSITATDLGARCPRHVLVIAGERGWLTAQTRWTDTPRQAMTAKRWGAGDDLGRTRLLTDGARPARRRALAARPACRPCVHHRLRRPRAPPPQLLSLPALRAGPTPPQRHPGPPSPPPPTYALAGAAHHAPRTYENHAPYPTSSSGSSVVGCVLRTTDPDPDPDPDADVPGGLSAARKQTP